MKFTELVDLKDLKELGESFSAFTRIGSAISDTEGNILVSAGWQDICAKFHRVNPVTWSRCRESDMSPAIKIMQRISPLLDEAKKFILFEVSTKPSKLQIPRRRARRRWLYVQ